MPDSAPAHRWQPGAATDRGRFDGFGGGSLTGGKCETSFAKKKKTNAKADGEKAKTGAFYMVVPNLVVGIDSVDCVCTVHLGGVGCICTVHVWCWARRCFDRALTA